MDYVVRAAIENDWRTLRAVRLEALADAPTAFETTLEQARGYPEERWRARSGGSTGLRDFLAFTGDDAVGMTGLSLEDDGSGEIISVWVHPDHRGRGVARSLVAAAMTFGTGAGIARFGLWVAQGNTAATVLYERLGFTLTGARKPISTRPSIDELQMEVVLP